MPELSYRSNQIKLNYPSKVLAGSLTNQTGESYWDHANGSDDPWYSGAFTKKFYRWEVTFTVTEANHGSHLTRESKKYNGLDVVVGDWLGGAASGLCV